MHREAFTARSLKWSMAWAGVWGLIWRVFSRRGHSPLPCKQPAGEVGAYHAVWWMWDHRTQEAIRVWFFFWFVVVLHPVSLTFCVICLPLFSQHGARYFPTYRLLSRDSGPSGHTKLKRGFRNSLMHTRICIQVFKFLETVSKDGICCFLRLDLPLRWPCWLAPLWTSPSSPAPPPFCTSSPCAWLPSESPLHSLLPHSHHWLALSFCHHALLLSVPLGQGSANYFCKRPDRKYFIFWRVPYCLCCIYSTLSP